MTASHLKRFSFRIAVHRCYIGYSVSANDVPVFETRSRDAGGVTSTPLSWKGQKQFWSLENSERNFRGTNRIKSVITSNPFSATTILRCCWSILQPAFSWNRAGNFSASSAKLTHAPLGDDPLGLGSIQRIFWIFVNDIVKFENLWFLRCNAVNDCYAVLITGGNIIESTVSIFRVDYERNFRTGSTRRKIWTWLDFFGSSIFVAISIGQCKVRAICTFSWRNTHDGSFPQGSLSTGDWTHLPGSNPPSVFKGGRG